MSVESAHAATVAGAANENNARQVRLPPLWLFAILAAIMLMLAAPKDYGDVFEYHCYALDFWQGASVANHALPIACSKKIFDLAQAPFQELPREYGPLSLVLFSLPLIFPVAWYNTIFNALMCAVVLGVAWLLDRFGPRGAGHMWLLYTLLGVMMEAAGRFDVAPVALVLIALLAAQRRRSLLAYSALAFGTLLKFFPVALLPFLLIDSWRRRREEPLWKAPALFAAIIGVGEGVAFLISPARALQPLGFMGARCVEAESLPATLSYLWASVSGGHVKFRTIEQFSSTCQFVPGTDAIPTLVAVVGLAGLAAIFWLYWRGRLNLTQGFLFATGVIILSVKVFSVQYLLWLSPLIAFAYGLDASALIAWSAVCLATTLFYPVAISPWVIAHLGSWLEDHSSLLIAIRNLLLLVAGGLALRAALRRPPGVDGVGDAGRTGALAVEQGQ